MTVFDREGNFLRSWGEGMFVRPHGVHFGPDDTIYCTDDGDHTVRQLTTDGKLLVSSRWTKRMTVIDLATGKVERQVRVGKSPHGVWTLDHVKRQ